MKYKYEYASMYMHIWQYWVHRYLNSGPAVAPYLKIYIFNLYRDLIYMQHNEPG
jgi:hypothetical protein